MTFLYMICILSCILFANSNSNSHSNYNWKSKYESISKNYLNPSPIQDQPYEHTIIWMGSQEGLAMQLLNLELLWNIAIINQFNILIVSYHNRYHYPDSNTVSLCSTIELPINIRCMIVSNRTEFMTQKHISGHDVNKLRIRIRCITGTSTIGG